MGKPSREKGKRGEREVAKILRDHGYNDARRGVQFHGGPESPDVTGLPGVHIEVKRTEICKAYDFLAQSIFDAGEDIPIVVHRQNGRPWIVIMSLEDFLDVYKGFDENNKKVEKKKKGSRNDDVRTEGDVL